MIAVSIPGPPVGKGRPRVAVRNGRAHAYTPAPTQAWEATATTLLRNAHQGPPLFVAVRVVVRAVGARPRALLPAAMGGTAPRSRPPPAGRCWRTTKPDADNVAKAALDAMVKAGVIRDDVQVVSLLVESLYASVAEGPSVEIEWEAAP